MGWMSWTFDEGFVSVFDLRVILLSFSVYREGAVSVLTMQFPERVLFKK
jgi:hypothetical protein